MIWSPPEARGKKTKLEEAPRPMDSTGMRDESTCKQPWRKHTKHSAAWHDDLQYAGPQCNIAGQSLLMWNHMCRAQHGVTQESRRSRMQCQVACRVAR